MGGSGMGHYYACCRNDAGWWWKCDDDDAAPTLISADAALLEQAYMLFYDAVQKKDAHACQLEHVRIALLMQLA